MFMQTRDDPQCATGLEMERRLVYYAAPRAMSYGEGEAHVCSSVSLGLSFLAQIGCSAHNVSPVDLRPEAPWWGSARRELDRAEGRAALLRPDGSAPARRMAHRGRWMMTSGFVHRGPAPPTENGDAIRELVIRSTIQHRGTHLAWSSSPWTKPWTRAMPSASLR